MQNFFSALNPIKFRDRFQAVVYEGKITAEVFKACRGACRLFKRMSIAEFLKPQYSIFLFRRLKSSLSFKKIEKEKGKLLEKCR